MKIRRAESGPLLLLDSWQIELHLMLCLCGESGCPRYASQILALSPEMIFDDRTEAISKLHNIWNRATFVAQHDTTQ